jgi:hypothetical protein
MTITAEEFYTRYIKTLPVAVRLRVLEIAFHDLIQDVSAETGQERSLLELEGLGAEIWQGVDAQAYVDELRKEWDHRP